MPDASASLSTLKGKIENRIVKIKKMGDNILSEEQLVSYRRAMASNSMSDMILKLKELNRIYENESSVRRTLNGEELSEDANNAYNEVRSVDVDVNTPENSLSVRKQIASIKEPMPERFYYDTDGLDQYLLARKLNKDGYIESQTNSASMSERPKIIVGTKKNILAKIRVRQLKYTLLNVIPDYTNFFLTNVSESSTEKYQLIETFSDNIISMYGKRPTITSFSGQLLNTVENPWREDFYIFYRDYLRGTMCIENMAIASLIYDGMVVEGYVVGMNIGLSSTNDRVCPFSFSMFVTNTSTISGG